MSERPPQVTLKGILVLALIAGASAVVFIAPFTDEVRPGLAMAWLFAASIALFFHARRCSPPFDGLWVTLSGIALVAGLICASFYYTNLSPRTSARRVSCINNLRQIDGAKDQYALEYGSTNGMLLTPRHVAIYIKDMNKCFCPLLVGTNRTFENSYVINVLTVEPTCKVGTNKNHDLAYSGK